MPSFVFDTCVLIDYLRNERSIAADAIILASTMGTAFVPNIAMMEIARNYNKKKKEIDEEIKAIEVLINTYNLRIAYVYPETEKLAYMLVRQFYSALGKNTIIDCYIIATGIRRRAWLITSDKKWFKLPEKSFRSLGLRIKVLSPEELVRRF
jgi:predicted nucleic acid-binding protein